MGNKLQLELYTRTTCSDCQEAKKYLISNGIHFEDNDVGKTPNLEVDLKQISGTRIVPMFAFYKKGLLGKKKLVKYFIGFENNKSEIINTLNMD